MGTAVLTVQSFGEEQQVFCVADDLLRVCTFIYTGSAYLSGHMVNGRAASLVFILMVTV